MKAGRIGLALTGAIASVVVAAPSASASASAVRVQRNASCTVIDGTADSACTPGAFNTDVTQDTIYSTICVSGWTSTIRPSASYTTALKNQQKIAYGEADVPNSELEEDHLVPLELGGAPRDSNNLWPEPRTSAGTTDSGQAAEDKDREENALKTEVCNGNITLGQAQQQILADWTH